MTSTLWQQGLRDSFEAMRHGMVAMREDVEERACVTRASRRALQGSGDCALVFLEESFTGVRLQPALRCPALLLPFQIPGSNQSPGSHSAPPRPPARRAMAELAREVVTAGAVLSSSLSRVPPGTRPNLAVGADQVERGAVLLLLACAELRVRPGSREDQDWAYTVLSAGAVILDCGSKATACAEASTLQAIHHASALQCLLRTLLIQEAGGGEALVARLRATSLRPDAVLACVRRLFTKDWDGVAGEGQRSHGALLLLHQELGLLAPLTAAAAASTLNGWLPLPPPAPPPSPPPGTPVPDTESLKTLGVHIGTGERSCHGIAENLI